MTSTEVAKSKPSLAQLIEQLKPEIGRALPRHMSPDRMARIATTVLRQNPKLAGCSPESFLGSLMTASQLGLEPGPLGEAWLVPYGRECTFIPGYRGLVKLAYQSGSVSVVKAAVVYEADDFDYQDGTDSYLRHKAALTSDRGKPIAVFCTVKLKDGGTTFDVMSVSDIEAVRKRSKSGQNGPWVSDWAEMAKKTVFRRLSKWLPMSAEFQLAVAHDETVRTDVSASLSDVTPDYIEAEAEEQE